MTTKKPGLPFADTNIAIYLNKRIDQLAGRKSQREIATEIGYEKPNMISMFKRGEVKVPLDKIPALATALEVDPAYLFRLAMDQYWPDRGDAIASIFGMIVTSNEADIIREIRNATNDGDPALTSNKQRKALRAVFEHEAVTA